MDGVGDRGDLAFFGVCSGIDLFGLPGLRGFGAAGVWVGTQTSAGGRIGVLRGACRASDGSAGICEFWGLASK